MSLLKVQLQESARRLFTENWPMKLFAAILFIAFVGAGCSYFSKDKTAVMDADRQQAKIINQSQEILDLKIELSAANKHGVDLATIIEQKNQRISDLETQIAFASVPGEVAETRIDRDDSIPLVDQLNNPGGLIVGPRADRFGSTANIDGHAYFPDRVDGIAALIDLIMAHQGATIEQYIKGGGPVKPAYSYTGGVGNSGDEYIQVIEQNGIKRDTEIHLSDSFLLTLVRSHNQMEGGEIPISELEFTQALRQQAEVEKNR